MIKTMNLPNVPAWLLFALFVWSLSWKGLALWNCAKNSQRNWFVAILILNTVGLLEIAYLFYFAKRRLKIEDIKFWK